MDVRKLAELCCPSPSCAGTLRLEPAGVRPSLAPAPHSHEVIEGLVCCEACHTEYPNVAGVLILADDVRTYVSAHYALVLTCAAAEGVLGPEMLHHLRA